MKPPELNRWSFLFGWQRDYCRRESGWRTLDLAIIRLHTMPEDGEAMTHGKHYRGVWFHASFWLPWEVSQWR